MSIRKYLSEFAVSMRANQLLVLQPSDLEGLSEEYNRPPYQCHIYAIARRPRVTFDTGTIVVTPDKIKADIVAQSRGKSQLYSVETPNFPSDPVVNFECEYPYSEYRFINSNGDVILEGPVVQLLTKIGVGRKYPELVDLELLYIGQAYGKDGSRTAPKRLGHHESLQKILAEAIRRDPDMDIWVVLFSFVDMIIASLDGRAETYAKSKEEDTAHLWNILGKQMTEAHRINYCEAAMIRYFQPQYNTEFKASFPNANHLPGPSL